MPIIENATAFAARDFLSIDKEGADTLVICLCGSFRLPGPGKPGPEELPLADEQPEPMPEDVYWGDPGTSSLQYEGQSAYFRPGTDIYVNGQAWAPLGRPVKEMLVAVRVGACRKGLQVFGDRVWRRGITGWRSSSPEPFESMPLRYERSFGGPAPREGDRPRAYEERNPLGRGFHPEGRDAVDQPLPNLEEPLRLLSAPTERVPPAGFGAIARAWQPRLAYGGTYDQKWIEQRAPLWPLDFDVRFFQAASPGLVATPWLEGGEPVVLSGLSPDGTFSFHLSRPRLVASAVFRDRTERRRLRLDAVLLEPDERLLRLYWRVAFPAERKFASHEQTLVRELESWEDG
ncbi:DUF2169 domain-containing protein [Archangium violaceum]|uniref:DUF2169 family type VI secretion system accessory protein n=1 Tax=Archangium violaceum TaxID=83451 RepID=UPI00193B50F0|nr:DUF2169 domain-containing protein [Archangium violaceum]QRK11094.1 DUF2169 domain-containing protein [Archangium violaceum]